jgi:single-strand DNA-binding protein
MILVEGALRTGSYTDKNHSDVTHYTTDVFVDGVEFCESKKNGNSQNSQTENSDFGDLSEFEEIIGDDVPF